MELLSVISNLSIDTFKSIFFELLCRFQVNYKILSEDRKKRLMEYPLFYYIFYSYVLKEKKKINTPCDFKLRRGHATLI